MGAGASGREVGATKAALAGGAAAAVASSARTTTEESLPMGLGTATALEEAILVDVLLAIICSNYDFWPSFREPSKPALTNLKFD
jgi:hypothetical protein